MKECSNISNISSFIVLRSINNLKKSITNYYIKYKIF